MHLKIEPVKSEELALLASISRKTFYDTFHAQNSKEDMDLFLERTFTEEVLRKEMLKATKHFFFAKHQDEILGYMKLSTEALPELQGTAALEIASLYVLKDKIGFGVGKAMMEFAIDFARQHNKKTVFLGVWEHNQRAIQFYKNFGFEKFSEHIFLVGNDAQTDWWMKKELSAE